MRFIDSHLHLDYPGAQEETTSAREAGTVLFACGVDRGSSLALLELSRQSPDVVRAFVGVHPSEAAKDPDLGWLEGAAAEAAGVGEIGLDRKYSDVEPGTPQAAAFEVGLRVARKLGKPVQIHSRGLEMRCIDLASALGPKQVLMHWLASGEALPVAMDKGYYVSFGPALLYSKRLQRLAKAADPDLVLAESDSPVPYDPLGGARGPSLIPSVVFRLAGLWGVGFEEAGERILENSRRYLGVD